MVIYIHSKYTFMNCNTPNYIPYNLQDTFLYTDKVATKLVTFTSNETSINFFGWKPN